jgi:hypothetical protein
MSGMLCPICTDPMKPYYNAAEGMRLRGWLCTKCKGQAGDYLTSKAIGRERLLTKWEVEKTDKSSKCKREDNEST